MKDEVFVYQEGTVEKMLSLIVEEQERKEIE